MNVPSLAEIRPFLSPRPAEWVDSILAGVPNPEFSKKHGLGPRSVEAIARYVAEAAGLEMSGGLNGSRIRESVLRMRIRELEERNG